MIEEVRAFEGGYCRQLLGLIDRRSWRLVRFQAVFLALRHLKHGWVLVDTGYGTRFNEATNRFPYRFYRWATPARSAGRASDLLRRSGIDPVAIRHVVVTHFHADHVGGLSEFPAATVHFHAGALDPLQRLTPYRQVHAAFLPSLVPEDLHVRAVSIAAEAFTDSPELGFETFDLFGDGSLHLVHLPGHAPGQVGLAFAVKGRREFYAADAFWSRSQIEQQVEPFGVAMKVQWDPKAYRETVRRLRLLSRRGVYQLSACHDAGTAARLNGLAP